MSEPKGIFLVPSTTRELIQDFSNEEIGAVFCALINYTNEDILPTFEDRALQCLFRSLQTQTDGYCKRYQERCEKNRQNVAKRWNTKDTTVYDGTQSNTKDTTVYDGTQSNTKDTTVYDNNSRIPINKIEQNKIEQNKIECGEKEKEKENPTSSTTMLNDESWSEALMMKHHITKEQLVAYLSDFELDQRCRGGTEHEDERDMKRHFDSWLMIRRKNEREEKAKNRNPLGLYDSQEKDYRAGGW